MMIAIHFRKGIVRMARKVEVRLLDDIDGSVAAETLSFGLDGALYEIDLSSRHADKLRSSLAKYISHARRVGRAQAGAVRAGGQHTVRADRQQRQAIRDWARAHGYEVNDRGRIPANVVEEYQVSAGRTARR